MTKNSQDKNEVLKNALVSLFSDVDPVDEKKQWETERKLMGEVCPRLEEKYSDRGLRFTQNFGGACPVQAYGVIDNTRFYFRYRHDRAQLTVGMMDPDEPERTYAKQQERSLERRERINSQVANGKMTKIEAERELAWENIFMNKGPVHPNGKDDYPTLVKKTASISGYADDPWAGVLSPEECEDVFARLVDLLEDDEYDLHARHQRFSKDES